MQFPVVVGLRRSRVYTACLPGAVSLAVAALLATPWPAPWPPLLVGATLLLGVVLWRRSYAALPTLLLAQDGRLAWRWCDDDPWTPVARVMPRWVHPWLVVLAVIPEEGARIRHLLIWADSCSPEAHRQLRLWLRAVLPVSAARPTVDVP